MNRSISRYIALGSSGLRRLLLVVGFGVAGAVSVAPVQAQEMCGGQNYPFPYTDVSGVGAQFCPGIMEAYVTGVTKGTSPTTFSPNETVPRLQMTTFMQRSLDQGLTRASRRAALNQWSTPQTTALMQTIAVGGPGMQFCAADGDAIWATNAESSVFQVQASTGKVLGTWIGATLSEGVLVAAGKVFVVGDTAPGSLYMIDPALGTLVTVASNLGNHPFSIANSGFELWTANNGPPGSVSLIIPRSTPPYIVVTMTAGFNAPYGILFDGAHLWVTDTGAGTLLELDPFSGGILQTVTVGRGPQIPVFDGTNIWVPNFNDSSITVVQPSNPAKVVATIASDASNKLDGPMAASFDGERILVTNNVGNSVTVFKAADLSLIANVSTGASTFPFGACSDGINFWVTLYTVDGLLRF